MRLDLAVVGLAGVFALSSILLNYAHAIHLMENFNIKAWAIAEEAAREWASSGAVTADGFEVTVRNTEGWIVYKKGDCRTVLGYAYTFIIYNNTLYKVEVAFCSPP